MKYRIAPLLIIFCLWAGQLYRAEAEREFKVGEDILEAWRFPEAEAIAAKALKDNPKSAAALEFDGRIKFYQGRYQEALTVLDRALAIDSKDPRRQAMKLLIQLTLDVHKSFKRYESAHFILFVDEKRDAILVPHALDALEKTYEAIGAELGYLSQGKGPRRSGAGRDQFQRHLDAVAARHRRDRRRRHLQIQQTDDHLAAGALLRLPLGRFDEPRVSALRHRLLVEQPSADLAARGHGALLRNPLAQAGAGQRRRHEDYLTPANQTLLVQALEKNQFVGFKKMEPSLIHLDTPEQVQLAYAEAASAVDFINQSKGKAGVRDLLATLKDKPTPEAVEKVYGMGFDAFETKWKAFLKAKGLKPIEGTPGAPLAGQKRSTRG